MLFLFFVLQKSILKRPFSDCVDYMALILLKLCHKYPTGCKWLAAVCAFSPELYYQPLTAHLAHDRHLVAIRERKPVPAFSALG